MALHVHMSFASTTSSCLSHNIHTSNFYTFLTCYNKKRGFSVRCSAKKSRNFAKTLETETDQWPENFAVLNYEDLCKHYEPVIFKEELQPHTFLANVMSEIRYIATADQRLEEVDYCFLEVSGLPVVDKDFKCIGVISKKDKARASKGLQSTVGEVMSSPPITMPAEQTVNDAAVVMLKNKIHRIPIVNEGHIVIGIVTRTDIFTALEGEQ